MQASEGFKVAVQAFDCQIDALQALFANSAVFPQDAPAALIGLQTLFQTRIRAWVMAEQWEAGIPIVTEMHRHLRLLGVDLNFLRAAKQPTTRRQRLQQVEQRLSSLKEFSQGLRTLIV
ncbi:MAG: heterocyst frequency control protein PatD [Cyanobacteria bacterium P01_A01_bin.114]